MCVTRSSADDESETNNVENIKRTSKYHQNGINFNIPKPELKVSHYSKNNVNEHITSNEKRRNVGSNSEKAEIHQSLSAPSALQNYHHHHVVDVVPKPSNNQPTLEWNLLDQTIGIPITDMPQIIHYPLISANIPASNQLKAVDKNSLKNRITSNLKVRF